MLRLQSILGLHENRIFEFDRDSIVIGRADHCDLRIEDYACSGTHAKIHCTDGRYWIVDLKSTNGVLVNGQKVERSELGYGDRIAIGRSLFVFLSEMRVAKTLVIDEELGPEIEDMLTSSEAASRLEEILDAHSLSPGLEETGTIADEEDLRRRGRQVRVLHRLGYEISRSLEPEDLHRTIAKSFLESLEGAHRVGLFRTDEDSDALRLVRMETLGDDEGRPVDGSILQRVRRERVAVRGVESPGEALENEDPENVRSAFLCAPLIAHEQFLGIVYVESAPGHRFEKDLLELLAVAANQIAMALENATLYEELRVSCYEAVRSLCKTLENKDPYTSGHSERVAAYAVGIGESLGLSPERLENLRFAAELHDIGKIAIRQGIIGKKGRLTDEEFEAIREHPQLGVEILKPFRFLKPVLPGILHHHERFNGEGYPGGLEGEEIPLEARIINLTDAFDAMTTQRPYNRPLSYEQALAQCRSEAGISFDADCVDALEHHLQEIDQVTEEFEPAR